MEEQIRSAVRGGLGERWREIAQPHFPEDEKRRAALRCVCVVLCCGAGQRGRDIRTLRRVGVRLGIGMCGARMDAIFLKEKKKFL